MTPVSRYLYVLALIAGVNAGSSQGSAVAFLFALIFATTVLIIETVKEGRQ